MQNRERRDLKFCDGKNLAVWGILDLANTHQNMLNNFISGLQREGSMRGLNISAPVMIEKSDENHLGEDFAWFHDQLTKEKGRKPGRKK